MKNQVEYAVLQILSTELLGNKNVFTNHSIQQFAMFGRARIRVSKV